MDVKVKEGLKQILEKSVRILKKEDVDGLDTLSIKAVENASIYQDKDSIQLAVIVYALTKIAHRSETIPGHWSKIHKDIEKYLGKAMRFLEKDNEVIYRNIIKKVFRIIGEFDEKLKLYIDDVLDKARIVKGSKIYERGVSIGRASELLGISQWELMSYVGKTKIVDQYKEEVISPELRIDHAKKIFGV